MDAAGFARLFDHTVLRPDATHWEVASAAEVAVTLGTANLTVQPHYVRFAAERLAGSGVLVGTVVGFPHGNDTPAVKARATREAVEEGADEVDMVMNIPTLKGGDQLLFLRDVEGVIRAAPASGSLKRAHTSSRCQPAPRREAPPSTTSV